MSIDQAYNYQAIDERVSTAGLLSEEQLSALAASGYEAVVNLLPHGSPWAVAGEEDIVLAQGIDYFYIPVDFADPTDRDYAAFTDALESCRGKKTMIHCAANYRVSAFYAIYAYTQLGWTASQARQHIASLWRPQENPPWDAFISRYIPDDG